MFAFTIHFATINTIQKIILLILFYNLQYTLLLLIHFQLSTIRYRFDNLQYTLLLLILPGTDILLILIYNLQYTLLLLIQEPQGQAEVQ